MQNKLMVLGLVAGLWFGRPASLPAQSAALDGIAAVVGTHPILYSDLAREMTTFPLTDSALIAQHQCLTLEGLIHQKLLLIQAEQDSITIDPKSISNEINRRMSFFIQQFGGVEHLEEFYGKPLPAIKEEMRKPLRELMMIDQARQKVLKHVYVTPSEVKDFFSRIPPDSLPFFNMQVKVAHLVRKPRPLPEDEARARRKAEELRRRILAGESFESLAILYSDDIASATKGGDLGYVPASDLEPAYANAARGLLIDSVSEIVQTRYGYHIIRLKGRRGDALHTQHILIRPRISEAARQQAVRFLDSLRSEILAGRLRFEEAARQFSDDIHTRNNGGLLINPETSNALWYIDQLDVATFTIVDTLDAGQISTPYPYKPTPFDEQYRIIHLIEKIPPHPANLAQDWEAIAQMALNAKKQETLQRWLDHKARITYIKIAERFDYCANLDKYRTYAHSPKP